MTFQFKSCDFPDSLGIGLLTLFCSSLEPGKALPTVSTDQAYQEMLAQQMKSLQMQQESLATVAAMTQGGGVAGGGPGAAQPAGAGVPEPGHVPADPVDEHATAAAAAAEGSGGCGGVREGGGGGGRGRLGGSCG